ncbi:MAG: hypothetical protein NZ932_05285 [Candidatus Bathyarchaeota archaeon]|nr:hypothetical protein [Candidatus Bathyarchaeota archaeon]
MGRRQLVLETNIDWQSTLDKIKEKREREIGQPLDGYIRPGVFIRITRKGLIVIKLKKYDVTLLISPNGTLQVVYKTEFPMGDTVITPEGEIILDVKESPTSGREAIDLGWLLHESGLLELLATVDGSELKFRFKKYIRFRDAWERDWIFLRSLHSETFQDAIKIHLDSIKLTRLLKRVVYDNKLRDRIRIIIDAQRDEEGKVNPYDLINVLLGKLDPLDISLGMRNLFS